MIDPVFALIKKESINHIADLLLCTTIEAIDYKNGYTQRISVQMAKQVHQRYGFDLDVWPIAKIVESSDESFNTIARRAPILKHHLNFYMDHPEVFPLWDLHMKICRASGVEGFSVSNIVYKKYG